MNEIEKGRHKNPSEWTDQELIVNTLKLVRSLQDIEPVVATTTENWNGHEIEFLATLESVAFGPKTLEQIDSALEAAERVERRGFPTGKSGTYA
jgi:hypothetical protein